MNEIDEDRMRKIVSQITNILENVTMREAGLLTTSILEAITVDHPELKPFIVDIVQHLLFKLTGNEINERIIN